MISEGLNEQRGFEIVIPAKAGIHFGFVDSGSRPE